MNRLLYRTTKRMIAVVALAVWLSVAASPWPVSPQATRASAMHSPPVMWPVKTQATGVVSPALTDSLKTDPETGLAIDNQLTLVKGQCTACHSGKLILQSHFSRERWIERIRWMQRTQKLWDLGESEPAIVAYLVKYYGPVDQAFDGRRAPLTGVKWSKKPTSPVDPAKPD